MPKVGKKKFAYTFTGMKKARAEAAKQAKQARHTRTKGHKWAMPPQGSGMGEGEEAKHKKALAKYHSKQADKPSPHTTPTSGKDLMKFGGGASQGSLNVKKEYARQEANEAEDTHDRDRRAKYGHIKAAEKKSLKGAKPPSLPKNWRSLPANDPKRVAFRAWYKENMGKKSKTKKPKINLRKHLARFERATGQK